MQQKKRHHYVPALLGRRFLLNPEDKTFYYYDADERTIKPCSPIDAFRIKDFHTLEIEGGEKDRNTIEDLFGTIEGAGASAVSLFTSVSVSKVLESKESVVIHWRQPKGCLHVDSREPPAI